MSPHAQEHPLDNPPTPEALLARLRALAQAPGRSWPGGDALASKLAKPAAPAAAWSRLAHAIHTDWLKGQEQPEPELQELFIDSVALAWEGLAEADRLRSGLYPALIRALGARGHLDALATLAGRLAPFAAEDDAEPAIAALLRQLRQHHLFAPLHALLDGLRPAALPSRAWSAPLLAGVLALAREADDFDALRSAATWLPELLDAAEAQAPVDAGHWRELGKLALRTLQVPAMQRVVQALLNDDGMQQSETQPLLVQLLGLLASFAPDATTRAQLVQAATQQPRHPAIQLARARIAHGEGASLAEVGTLLDGLDPAQPAWPLAMSWLAGTRFHGGDDAGALMIYRELAGRHLLSAADRLRMNHLSARDDPAEPGGAPDASASAPTTEPPAWSPETLGPFAAALAPLIALLDEAPNHDASRSVASLQAAADAACDYWRSQLPQLPDISMQACLQLARHLAQLEAGAFASHSQWLTAFPFALGPAYGRVDARRCRVFGRALQQHVVALCDFALARPRALQGAPGQASLRQVLDLAEQRCEAQWALAQADEAAAALARLQTQLGTMGAAPLRELRARAALTLGRLTEAAELMAGAAEPLAPNDVLPLADWDDWLAAEQVHPQTLVDDPALTGYFDAAQPDGEVQRHAHQLAPTRLTVLHHTDLRVRNSHLLIGPRAGILRPGAWHLSMGDYPYEHRHVRLRGGGPRAGGAVLRPAHWQRIDTPVLVLANMDATYHRNFYHWMLLLLARIDALRARGLLLGGRKLLMPRELSGWMRSSLADIGLTEEQMLLYGGDDDLLLGDALLVSPIDFASPSLVEGLRQTMWRHAGLDPSSPPEATRLLYISRRGEGRRPLVEEARIQRAAEAMGFEAVAPETLTLAEQVRLFATARGIAGPPGAAYTNLIWAQPGTRVLSIFKEEANLPTFIDLSIIRGQSHRWLLGRNLGGYALMSIVNAPFSVDLALAERELAWVAGGSEQA
ncbi:MAG TPA: glycosyltransferase 61 family protein [Ideonella sp.]|uniref:glycosyltransferase 61 family protein n=1 Tax=Ideonella sp. TaxID=1929293 RepID=UPI002E313D63|nr:glycosyltransferase 61 family protein [Ideonella sp.]HEX5687183.1 glycosyltransferase 61 family protein [Ideonella sp.]